MDLYRYNRQTILSGFGEEAQEKLFASRVLVVGAGGLGCPVLQFLGAAGIGAIGIVDFDTVDISNLHRQILFDENSIGRLKAEVAKEKLQTMNSEIEVKSYPEKLTIRKAISLVSSYDVVVDCTDNFQIRYLLNDVCRLKKKPLVYGAIYQYEGQVSVFNVEKDGIQTNYRDLFPNPPQPAEVPNCNEAGVLGTLSGMVGTIQANEVLKLITGVGEPLIHKLWILNILNYESRIFSFKNSEKAKYPKNERELLAMDYEEICGISASVQEIENRGQLKAILQTEKSLLVDVRNEDELPKIQDFEYQLIPLSILEEQIENLQGYNPIVFVCRLGARSVRAVQIAKDKYPEKDIRHIRNGIETIL